ncbi:MAG: DUF5680 domain-containing protein [Clostridium sp.]|nr:DUF5680 domain-containing protein [Clostridium sp.]
MEFKEKLQLLRTNRKLSQEELADKLGISRQSITKWENGQSFPDIQNLICLSEIFKVSIDRLVKENDTCMVSLFCNQKYPMQDIRAFLVRAKNNTYITGENETMPSQPASHDFRYEDGNYLYMDTYLGGQKFSGGERVWVSGQAVWAMNYYGQSLKENFDIAFLKEVLSHVSVAMPFRGPEFYQKGDYMYQCQVQGDFECFTGEERIYCRQEKVFICTFHGGIIL